MEDRRKIVGQKIKRERRRLGYRSQEAFGKAIGFHETTVANAERGSDRTGDAAYEAIEAGLEWPDGSIVAYIAGAGPEPWALAAEAQQLLTAPAVQQRLWPTDEEIIAMSTDDLAGFALKLKQDAGSQAAEDWLYHALSVRRDATRRNLMMGQKS